MAHPLKGNLADKVLVQLIEADVDIGFGLVDEARTYRASGQPELSTRVLQDAAKVIADIESRLQRLGDCKAQPFRPLLLELRNEIAAAHRPSLNLEG